MNTPLTKGALGLVLLAGTSGWHCSFASTLNFTSCSLLYDFTRMNPQTSRVSLYSRRSLSEVSSESLRNMARSESFVYRFYRSKVHHRRMKICF